MVVDDFDMGRSSFLPDETESPLITDPDRVLAGPIRLQRLQAIARRRSQVSERSRLIEKAELP
jgi:hypothetical protein